MKTIYIDTTNNQEVIVALTIDGTKNTVTKPLERQKAQVVLGLIDSLLKKHTLTIQEIDAIEVNPGPGSFTGVRVGVSIANALSFALGIPVNTVDAANGETVIEPRY